MRCPKCKESVIQLKKSEMQLRIKGAVILNDAGLHSKCYWCGEGVTLPIEVKRVNVEPVFTFTPDNHKK